VWGMAAIKSYRDLRVWQDAMDLTERAYRVTGSYPRTEMFGLTAQMRRAAVSIPSNIAEGYGRNSTGSYIHFLRTAVGSLKEHETHVLISERVGILNVETVAPFLDHAQRLGKMLNALIMALDPVHRSRSDH
jgi:four helix bundle protein